MKKLLLPLLFLFALNTNAQEIKGPSARFSSIKATKLGLANGTHNDPSLYFINNPQAGLYITGTNMLGFGTGGMNAATTAMILTNDNGNITLKLGNTADELLGRIQIAHFSSAGFASFQADDDGGPALHIDGGNGFPDLYFSSNFKSIYSAKASSAQVDLGNATFPFTALYAKTNYAGTTNISAVSFNIQTTDATPANICSFTMPSDSAVTMEARITGKQAGTGASTAGYVVFATAENVTGTSALIGAANQVHIREDVAGWDGTITVDNATDTIRVTVTGAAATTINWTVVVSTSCIKNP